MRTVKGIKPVARFGRQQGRVARMQCSSNSLVKQPCPPALGSHQWAGSGWWPLRARALPQGRTATAQQGPGAGASRSTGAPRQAASAAGCGLELRCLPAGLRSENWPCHLGRPGAGGLGRRGSCPYLRDRLAPTLSRISSSVTSSGSLAWWRCTKWRGGVGDRRGRQVGFWLRGG